MTPKKMSPFKSIVITGASSGLGEAIAMALAGPGVSLWLTGRDLQRLTTVTEECQIQGASVTSQAIDATDRDSMRHFIEMADNHTPLDLVIANAGISGGTGKAGESDDQAREIFDTNLTGVLNTLHPAIPRMQSRQSGHLAVMSSLAGLRGFPGAPAYSASKAAVKIYAEALRGSLRHQGINVSSICPGFVRSRMTSVNKFPMPFLMDTDKAARIIVKGLIRNRAVIGFPWQMYWSVSFLSLLPPGIASRLLGRLPAKE